MATLVAVLALLAGLVGAASASETEQSAAVGSRVTAVDATGSDTAIRVFTENLDPESVTATEAGEERSATVSTARDDELATEVVFVVDADNRNVANGVLADFLATLDDSVGELPASVQVAAVSAGAQADLVTRLTTDRDRPGDKLRAVPADQGSALRDGVIVAAGAFSDRADVVRTVIVLAGGADVGSVQS
ncbi:MAG: hypothetical protein AAFO29_20825, partial [Actinomycetota bacterium]